LKFIVYTFDQSHFYDTNEINKKTGKTQRAFPVKL